MTGDGTTTEMAGKEEIILTEVQRERIRLNRERALEIQRRRKKGLEQTFEKSSKRRRATDRNGDEDKSKVRVAHDESDTELEDFEIDSSPWVTKKEAMKMYCLPEGTLAVCSYEERQNPHHKGWTPMKLYARSEIRRRARERFGGLEGLRQERIKREEKKFQKDYDRAKNIFS